MCMLMRNCACTPVCAPECMNYLPVISQKKHIIQTAQDKALLNPVTDYNHSPDRETETERETKEVKVWKEGEKRNNRLFFCTLSFTVSISSHICLFCLTLSTYSYVQLVVSLSILCDLLESYVLYWYQSE